MKMKKKKIEEEEEEEEKHEDASRAHRHQRIVSFQGQADSNRSVRSRAVGARRDTTLCYICSYLSFYT